MNLGRAWTVFELRERDWETLQQLWWVCVKERNRLATEELTRVRHETPDGDTEAKQRDETIQKTMKAIIDTLVERNNAYQEAYELAKNDPSIDLYRPDHQYQESTYDLNVGCPVARFELDSEANVDRTCMWNRTRWIIRLARYQNKYLTSRFRIRRNTRNSTSSRARCKWALEIGAEGAQEHVTTL